MTPVNPKKVLYLSDGVSTSGGTLVLSAGFLESPNAATSRLLLLFDDGWASHDVPDDFILSVTFSEELGKVFALGRNGLIKNVGEKNVLLSFDNIKGMWKENWLPESEDRGNMTRIKSIGGTVFACGWGGQVYRLCGDIWVDIFRVNGKKKRVGFLDIAGISEEDIYAVGMDGSVYHYDGEEWNRKELGTNCNLHCVLCSSRGNVYIAGSEGAIYSGHVDRWEFIGESEFKENIWSLEEYSSQVYFSYGNSGIGRIGSKGIVRIDLGFQEKPTSYRLIRLNNGLLSIGAHDLVKYDGTVWTAFSWPESG